MIESWAVKYRPTKFADVRGQIDKVFLQNMAKTRGNIPPVILLSGPTGVGKTTVARIFAAALLCPNQDKGEPCGTCENCTAVYLDNHPAVMEKDAASNGTADHMRQLREACFTETFSDYRVVILDEAHSLSSQAWNVLLKLLEQPPTNTIFMLVTSERNKVPARIRSRALAFNFGKVAPKFIFERLTYICEKEEYVIEDLDELVFLSGGSLREAIMLLEQVKLSGSTVENSLKYRDISLELLTHAISNERAEGLSLLRKSWERHGDMQGLLNSLSMTMENILFIKYDIPVFITPKKSSLATNLAKAMSEEQWAGCMEVLADWSKKLNHPAQFSFMWSMLLKSLHGASSTLTPKINAKIDTKVVPVTKASTSSILGEFDL